MILISKPYPVLFGGIKGKSQTQENIIIEYTFLTQLNGQRYISFYIEQQGLFSLYFILPDKFKKDNLSKYYIFFKDDEFSKLVDIGKLKNVLAGIDEIPEKVRMIYSFESLKESILKTAS